MFNVSFTPFMKLLLFLFALVNLVFTVAIGQPIDKHGPYEVYYGVDIIEGKNNRLFLSTSGGLYISDNLGDQWERAEGQLNTIYFEPRFAINSDNDVLYAWDHNNGVYSTSDNGETWNYEIIIMPNGPTELTALGVHGNDIFAGTKTGLYHANGSDFLKFATPIAALQNKEITALHVEGQNVLAASKENGVFFSEDRGATWENISAGLPADFNPTGITVWQQTIFVYGELGGLYYSNDKGDTWLPKMSGLGLAQVTKLTVDGDHLYATTHSYNKVHRSDLGNGSWTLIDNGIPDGGSTSSLYVSGNNLIVVGWYGIYKSVDTGNSFVPSYNGVTDAFEFIDMQVDADGTVWAIASHTGLYKKAVDAELFTPVSRLNGGNYGSGLISENVLPILYENGVKMYNTLGNLWGDELPIDNIIHPTRLIRSGSEIFISSKVGGIFKYTGTATWETFNDGLVSLAVTDFINIGEELLVGTEDGLFSRAPGAAQWTKIIFAETDIGIRQLFVKGNVVLITGADYSTYLSRDSGVTWHKVAEMEGLDVGAYTSAEGVLYAASYEKLFASLDDGQSWAQRILPARFINSLLVANGNLFIGTLEHGIFSTSPKFEQEVIFAQLPGTSDTPSAYVYGEEPIDLSAFATSNLPVTFTSSNEDVAIIEETTLVIKGVGETTITAMQAGNELYAPAALRSQTIFVDKADQLIAFEPFTTKTYGDKAFSAAVISSSALDVEISSSDPSIAEIVAGKISILKAGIVTITASQPGSDLYKAAVPVSQELRIAKAAQSIEFEMFDEKTVEDSPFKLSATASSSLPVTFDVDGENIISLNGNEVIIVGPGTVNITAVQAGDDNYEPAPSVTRVLMVANVLGIEHGLPFSFYPNPTTAKLTLETSQSIRHIAVFNDKGQPCNVLWNRNQLDLSQLNAGCYYLMITLGDHIFKTKVIKI